MTPKDWVGESRADCSRPKRTLAKNSHQRCRPGVPSQANVELSPRASCLFAVFWVYAMLAWQITHSSQRKQLQVILGLDGMVVQGALCSAGGPMWRGLAVEECSCLCKHPSAAVCLPLQCVCPMHSSCSQSSSWLQLREADPGIKLSLLQAGMQCCADSNHHSLPYVVSQEVTSCMAQHPQQVGAVAILNAQPCLVTMSGT
jgi:hypothetical protein